MLDILRLSIAQFAFPQEIFMTDFLFRGSLADLDPDVYQLTQLEAERQARKLILDSL
jgi:hypothetical protein